MQKRRKGIKWDYNGDGRFKNEKLSKKDKRYWRRWNKRMALRVEIIASQPGEKGEA
jgi:hypothetical protein